MYHKNMNILDLSLLFEKGKNKKKEELKLEKEENILGTEKIGKLIRKFSIPCIISLLVNSLYNIVDQIFIRTRSWILRKWCNKHYLPTNHGRPSICLNVRRWLI